MSRHLSLFVLAVGLSVALPAAQTRTLPLDEVRPGMVGVGRTVFTGTTLEDFKVIVLGVLKNVIAPKRNLILARLEGGPLAKTGVIAGMSGSPVYIDGRLIGTPYIVRHFHQFGPAGFGTSLGNAITSEGFLYEGSNTRANLWQVKQATAR